MIKQVTAAVRMTPVVEAVTIRFIPQFIEDGRFVPNDIVTVSTKAMSDELVRVDAALRPLREAS